jgi:outer membrane protein OmpA-like peptidoglycan-associated protein
MLNAGGRPFDGILSVNLGVVFRFGGNIKPLVVYRPETIYPVPPVKVSQVERVTEWKDVATDVLILFRINESVLLRDARVQLGFLARLMHEYPEGTYTITGYADEGTGNPDLNYRLSRARADRVKDCLVSEFGISPSRLKTYAAGGVENRYYDDPSLSRSVIIRPDKN